MDYKALGSRIRSLRQKSGLTQAELAERVDVTTAYIGQIERGERKFSIETLVSIASILETSTDYLLRDNIRSLNAYTNELLSLLKDRDYTDMELATDIIRSVFERLDKSR